MSTRYEGIVISQELNNKGEVFSKISLRDSRWPSGEQNIVLPETIPLGKRCWIDLTLEGEKTK